MSVSSTTNPIRFEDKFEIKVRRFQRECNELFIFVQSKYKYKKSYKEALELAIKTYEEVYPDKMDDDELVIYYYITFSRWM